MKIILFRGRPGVGKTTISNAFATQTNFPILRKDDIYDISTEFIEEHEIRNKISYRALYKILETNSKTDSTFILDYPFQHQGDTEIIKQWCDKNNVSLKSILVICSDEKMWAKRFEERAKNPAPNQLVTSFESFKSLYGSMQIAPEEGELCVDTINSIESVLPTISEFVSK